MLASQPVVRFFEQQTIRPGDLVGEIRVDEELIGDLQRAAQGHLRQFLRAGHRTVSFRQYVGVFTLNGRIIELLPKVGMGEVDLAYFFLVELLRECGLLPSGYTLPPAGQAAHPLGLLHLFVEAFSTELDRLGARRLRQYISQPPASAPTLAGRIHWHRQATRHAGQVPAFIQEKNAYLTDHALHHYLGAALAAAQSWPLSTALRARCRALQRQWPAPKRPVASELPPPVPVRHRNRYARALQLAQLLLHGQRAGLRAGAIEAPALLFDMNALFERYVYQQLARHRPAEVQLQAQVPKTFWQKQYLRPDIVLGRGNDRVVLDVKWKLLPGGQPEADDLRQLYVYQRFFEAARGALLYPQLEQTRPYGPYPYAPTILNEPHVYDCQLLFVALQQHGQLNRILGRQIYEQLFGPAPGE